jgi:hypothetical protein
MILDDNIMPEKNLYYVGALIVKLLKECKHMKICELYSKYREQETHYVNMINFLLAIDWLFLCNMVEYDESIDGIKLCNSNV